MSPQYPTVLTYCLAIFMTAVVISDLWTHRIPNPLVVAAALVATLVHTLEGGAAGLLASLGGVLAGLAVLLPLFLARGMGAGDVKAIAAVGAFLGPLGVLVATLWILLFGMLGGILLLLVTGGYSALRSMLGRWMLRAYVLCTTGEAAHLIVPEGDAARRRFPYGLAIACGTAASLVWR